jgi:hypothetical protein
MHRREEWFRRARDGRFTAPARGIAMLLKNENRSRATFQQDARSFRRGVHPDTGA